MKKFLCYSLLINLILNMSTSEASIKIHTYVTKSNVKVFYVVSSSIPMIDIQIMFDAGSSKDGNYGGLSAMVHTMLDEGTSKHTNEEISYVFESTGSIFNASSSKDKSKISLRSLVDEEFLNPSIKMLKEILSKANFPSEALKLHKERSMAFIEESSKDPAEIAINTFYQSLYNKHPYANPTEGTKKSVGKITRNQLIDFYKKNLTRENAIIAIVSPFDLPDIKKITDDISSSMNSYTNENQTSNRNSNLLDAAEQKHVYKKFPSSQAHIYIGQLGIKRGDKRNLPLYIANYIFGGSGFNSRLMNEVRVKRGFAYSVYSYFYPLQDLGPFFIGVETKADQANDVTQLINNMIKEYIREGPTKKEVDYAKNAITNGFPLKLDSNADILSYISMIGYYDLPEDYLATFVHNISKVTHKDIVDAMNSVLKPEKFLTVVVGNEKSKIKK